MQIFDYLNFQATGVSIVLRLLAGNNHTLITTVLRSCSLHIITFKFDHYNEIKDYGKCKSLKLFELICH